MSGRRVVYRNEAAFRRTVAAMRRDGPASLQVLSDFDFTLTQLWSAGAEAQDRHRLMSCHKVLEQCGLLSDEYHAQAQALQRHYYPLEVSPSLDPANKALLMLEWVTRAHALLLEAGLTGRIIRAATASAVGSGGLRLREGALSLLRALDRAEVPVLLLSAGIADVIECVLREVGAEGLECVHVISNRCVFSGDAVVGFSEPVLHVFNKRAANFLSTPFFSVPGVERRGNVLLLGDSIGDAHMADGLPCVSEVLRIGLLSDAEERLAEYLLEYDAVLLDDPSLEFVQKLVRELLGDA